MDVYYSIYFSAMNINFQIRELNLRSYDVYPKNATEAIFEYIRNIDFKDEVSRLNCVYYCKTKEETVLYAMDDWINCGDATKEEVKLLELEMNNNRIKYYNQGF